MFNKSRSRGVGYSLLLVASIAGCSYTPSSTMNALIKVDPETTPAEDLRIMVAAPPSVRPQRNAITLLTKIKEKGGGVIRAQEYRLQQIPKGGDELRVVDDQPLYAFRIHPRDIAKFNAFRLGEAKEDDREGELDVDAKACRISPQLPTQGKLTIYLKTAELKDYVPIVRNVDMLEDMNASEIALAFPICTSANSDYKG